MTEDSDSVPKYPIDELTIILLREYLQQAPKRPGKVIHWPCEKKPQPKPGPF